MPDAPGVAAPILLREEKPKYTSDAMRAKVQGLVTVQAVVEPDGMVRRARVINALHPDLDEQALIAARRWTFTPARLNGDAVAVVIVLQLEFRLH